MYKNTVICTYRYRYKLREKAYGSFLYKKKRI